MWMVRDGVGKIAKGISLDFILFEKLMDHCIDFITILRL